MKNPRWIFFFASFIFLSSCLPFNTPPSENAPSIGTIVAATYAASVIETQTARPPATATSVNTATPTETPVPPTITPTFTATFILSTSTPSPTSTPTQTYTPAVTATRAVTATPAKYECELISQTPSNGTILASRSDFDWFWKVTNTGTKIWKVADIEYGYISGDKMHKTANYPLPEDIYPGDSIRLGADMVAPKQPGSYSTTWALKRGDQLFCGVTLKIIVE